MINYILLLKCADCRAIFLCHWSCYLFNKSQWAYLTDTDVKYDHVCDYQIKWTGIKIKLRTLPVCWLTIIFLPSPCGMYDKPVLLSVKIILLSVDVVLGGAVVVGFCVVVVVLLAKIVYKRQEFSTSAFLYRLIKIKLNII